jgi:predicted DNA-binding transcriptional regulator AlpA
VYRGKNMWSKAHVDRAFAKKPTPEGITEWHTVAEIQEKFGMTLSAIYNLASKEGIPKTKVGKEVRYSKNHFDVAKVVAEPEPPAEYTIAEAMAKFGMTRDQLYHYVKTYKITRTKRGKFTYLSRKELDDLLAPPTI